MSIATIVAAPQSRAAITAALPTLPAPITTIEAPGLTLSASITAPAPVMIPQPIGATTSSGTSWGTGTAPRACAMQWVAKLDWAKKWLATVSPSAVASAVTHLKPGDHVVMSGGSCGECPSCLAAHPTYCREAMPRSFGGRRMDGTTALATADGETVASHFFAQSSFATHCIAQARGAVPVPQDVPLDVVAPMGCGNITGAGAVIEALKVKPGDSIVVMGAGSNSNAAEKTTQQCGAA